MMLNTPVKSAGICMVALTVRSSGWPLDPTVSATMHIPADLTGVFSIIAAVTLAALLGIFLYSRGFGRRAPSVGPGEAIPTAPAAAIEGRATRPVPPSLAPAAKAELEPVIDWNAARD